MDQYTLWIGIIIGLILGVSVSAITCVGKRADVRPNVDYKFPSAKKVKIVKKGKTVKKVNK